MSNCLICADDEDNAYRAECGPLDNGSRDPDMGAILHVDALVLSGARVSTRSDAREGTASRCYIPLAAKSEAACQRALSVAKKDHCRLTTLCRDEVSSSDGPC